MDALGAAVAAKAAAEEQLVRERAAKRRVEEEKERLETELARERRRRVEAEAVLEVIGRACWARSEAEGGGGSPEKLEAKSPLCIYAHMFARHHALFTNIRNYSPRR